MATPHTILPAAHEAYKTVFISFTTLAIVCHFLNYGFYGLWNVINFGFYLHFASD